MSIRLRPRAVVFVRAVLLAAILLLTSCSEPDSGDSLSSADGQVFDLTAGQAGRITTGKVEAIAALVPRTIRERGTIRISGAVESSPPLSFYATDNVTPIGSEVDIAHLIGDVLGLKVEQLSYDWAQNFVKIDSGENDLVVSNVTVTEERKEKYDFATYRQDNLALEVPLASTWQYRDRKDLAGRRVGVGSGTNQEQLLVAWNAQNVAEGLPPIDIAYFQRSSDYYLALSSGRLDGYLGPNPTALYHSASAKETKILATYSGAGDELQGEIAVLTKKGNGLIQAVQQAINHTIANGTYRASLDRWGLGSEAVSASEINPPGLSRIS